MKFNWGHGIATVLVLFVLGIFTLIVKAHSTDFHIVEEDYYEKEIRYQERIDALKNAIERPIEVEYVKAENTISLAFDSLCQKGEIMLYNPSGYQKDSVIELSNISSTEIQLSERFYGKWKLKVEWEEQGKPHYAERTVMIL